MSDYFGSTSTGGGATGILPDQAAGGQDPYARLASSANTTGNSGTHVSRSDGWLDAYGQNQSKSWSDYYDQYRKNFSGQDPQGYGAMMGNQQSMSPGSVQLQWLLKQSQNQEDARTTAFQDFMDKYWEKMEASDTKLYDWLKGIQSSQPDPNAPAPLAHKGLVEGIFGQFGLTATEHDLSYFNSMLNNGWTPQDIRDNLVIQQQIRDLYAKHGKTLDPAGLQYWSDQLFYGDAKPEDIEWMLTGGGTTPGATPGATPGTTPGSGTPGTTPGGGTASTAYVPDRDKLHQSVVDTWSRPATQDPPVGSSAGLSGTQTTQSLPRNTQPLAGNVNLNPSVGSSAGLSGTQTTQSLPRNTQPLAGNVNLNPSASSSASSSSAAPRPAPAPAPQPAPAPAPRQTAAEREFQAWYNASQANRDYFYWQQGLSGN